MYLPDKKTFLERARRGNLVPVYRELLADHEGKIEERPPRVFLHEFLDTAINLRAIYWYHPPDYWDYCEHGERLNMQIIERFHAEGIRFFIPAQRLFMEGDS